MKNKTLDNENLAAFLSQNIEKDKIIPAVFDFFKFDCTERCHTNSSYLDKLIREFYDSKSCDQQLLTSIIEAVRMGKENAGKLENEIINTIVSYITSNLSEDISVEKIAEDLNLSYFYLCHIFKNKYGISVNTFRTQKRLELAMQKLISGNEKISDIAVSCGFNNVSYFTETFSKVIGLSPSNFRKHKKGICFHHFYDFEDMLLAVKLQNLNFIDPNITKYNFNFENFKVYEPNEKFGFLHEAAVIKYHGVLYASWYNCPEHELCGHTPICGKRSYDGGKTWTAPEIICDDITEKILFCPPVYGICDDNLYLFVNKMVAPDHIHSLDLYILNNQTDIFELVWSRPIPFKLNTNVVTLPNGKLMLPGRIGEIDGFPSIPAVLISDSGKIDSEWRLVKIAENDALPDGKHLVFPEISVMCADNILYMFCRNDQRKVPLVYIYKDFGETWSEAYCHDVPYVGSKIYAGNLSDGRNYLIANTDRFDRSKLMIYLTNKNSVKFTKCSTLFDSKTTQISKAGACHYPAAFEADGKLYIIATLNYINSKRGAVMFIVDLNDI